VEYVGRRARQPLDVRFDLAGLSGAPDSTRLGVGYRRSQRRSREHRTVWSSRSQSGSRPGRSSRRPWPRTWDW